MQQSSGSSRARHTLAYLKRAISSGEWPVNSKIPIETELMEMIGVGKTTIREAVRSLASVGMLETLPGRGTFVRSRAPVSAVLTDFFSDYDLEEILSYRRTLEVQAARLAATQRTQVDLDALHAAHARDVRRDAEHPATLERGRMPGQFHSLVFEAAGNRLLRGLYAGVMASLRAAAERGAVVFVASEEDRNRDHASVLAAIEAGDADAAAAAMADHVDRDLCTEAAAEPGLTAGRAR